jgi:hypothetical protein
MESIFSTLEPRLEIKITESAHLLSEFRSWVRSHHSALKEAFPRRQVNNIYFDTLGMDCLNDHLSGIQAHNKLRFRWYGISFHDIRGNLELKRKEEKFGKKILFPIEKKFDIESIPWRKISGILHAQADDTFKLLLTNTQPIMISQYLREYYITGDHRVRLTLDYKLKVFDQRFYNLPNLIYPTPLLDQLVIEIKSEIAHLDAAYNLINDIPLRIGKNSKYISSFSAFI